MSHLQSLLTDRRGACIRSIRRAQKLKCSLEFLEICMAMLCVRSVGSNSSLMRKTQAKSNIDHFSASGNFVESQLL